MRLHKTLASICLMTFAACASAQADYPKQIIRLIVPFSAGGVGDSIARPLAKELGPKLGQTVIVENKPGANTTMGVGFVAHAPADGYTLLLASDAGLAFAPNIQASLNYDPVRDLVPIAVLVTGSQLLLVNSNSPIHTLQEFVAEARRRPGGIPYASLGIGSLAHVSMEALAKKLDVPTIHVPYQGVAPAISDLVGGQVETMLAAVAIPLQLIKTGKLRAIAFAGDSRSPLLPEVRTFAELGVPFVSRGWTGIFAPAATPPAIVAKLRAAIQEIAQTPAFQKDVILANGYEASRLTAADLPGFVASEVARAKALVDPIRSQLK